MADGKASNIMILLVVLVAVLSVAFTWNVLSNSSGSNTEQTNTASNTNSVTEPVVPVNYETSGKVGVNIQTKEAQ